MTAHVAIGGLLGGAINQPLLAFLAGFSSHPVFDLTPTFSEKYKPWAEKPVSLKRLKIRRFDLIAALDCILALGLLVALSVDKQASLAIIAGGVGALLPDLDKLLDRLGLGNLPIIRQISDLHYATHFWKCLDNRIKITLHSVFTALLVGVITWIIRYVLP